MNANPILTRAFKTFLQAMLATWAVSGYDIGESAFVGAIAAGISAAMNVFIKPIEG